MHTLFIFCCFTSTKETPQLTSHYLKHLFSFRSHSWSGPKIPLNNIFILLQSVIEESPTASCLSNLTKVYKNINHPPSLSIRTELYSTYHLPKEINRVEVQEIILKIHKVHKNVKELMYYLSWPSDREGPIYFTRSPENECNLGNQLKIKDICIIC